MKRKVFWTKEAELTFEQNIRYLEREWNLQVIHAFVDKTEDAIALISTKPDIFPVINKKRKIHKCLLVKQVSLYYRVTEKDIYLLTFWNNYQHPDKLKL